jgi:hypothetical protein
MSRALSGVGFLDGAPTCDRERQSLFWAGKTLLPKKEGCLGSDYHHCSSPLQVKLLQLKTAISCPRCLVAIAIHLGGRSVKHGDAIGCREVVNGGVLRLNRPAEREIRIPLAH